jgi:4-hydroxy-3-methylbut-2-en-1-yl diphosphate synthase IspG/GcpE
MVQRILDEIRKNNGVVVLNDLAAKLNMEPDALKGILQTMNKSKRTVKTTAMPMCSRGTCAGCPFVRNHSAGICGSKMVMKLSHRR